MYYEKGWNAYVDGKLTPHFRTDYVLRGMKVPAGNHTIEFKFDGTFYGTGEKIALAGSILLFLFLGGGIYMDVIRKKNPRKWLHEASTDNYILLAAKRGAGVQRWVKLSKYF